MYDIKRDKWTEIEDMTIGRRSCGATQYNGTNAIEKCWEEVRGTYELTPSPTLCV